MEEEKGNNETRCYHPYRLGSSLRTKIFACNNLGSYHQTFQAPAGKYHRYPCKEHRHERSTLSSTKRKIETFDYPLIEEKRLNYMLEA